MPRAVSPLRRRHGALPSLSSGPAPAFFCPPFSSPRRLSPPRSRTRARSGSKPGSGRESRARLPPCSGRKAARRPHARRKFDSRPRLDDFRGRLPLRPLRIGAARGAHRPRCLGPRPPGPRSLRAGTGLHGRRDEGLHEIGRPGLERRSRRSDRGRAGLRLGRARLRRGGPAPLLPESAGGLLWSRQLPARSPVRRGRTEPATPSSPSPTGPCSCSRPTGAR